MPLRCTLISSAASLDLITAHTHSPGSTCTVCPPGAPIPQPLPDRRVNGQLPKSFKAADILPAEGATYSWLHSVIQNIYLWASCAEQGSNVKWQGPTGWTLNK
jgi:hypothetical protein